MSEKSDRTVGTVKWFSSSKGYGFIHVDGRDDIFVHYRSIRGDGYKTLNEGQQVEFIIKDGAKGPQADDVSLIAS